MEKIGNCLIQTHRLQWELEFSDFKIFNTVSELSSEKVLILTFSRNAWWNDSQAVHYIFWKNFELI